MAGMNSRKEHLDGLAVGILLACCMFWGLQQVLVKSIMHEVAPLFQASLRCMGACVLLLIWCRVRGIRLFERDGSWWPGLLAGALFAAEFACIYLGLRYTSASRLTVFLYTSPFWVAALVPVFVKSERLRALQWLGMACAFVAVAFAMREGLGAGNNSALGDLLGLAAGALWGLTTVSIRANNLTRISPEKLLFYQIAATALAVPWLSVALGRDLVLPMERSGLELHAGANRDRRFCQLPGLDVDARPLPGHQNLGVRVFDTAVCAAVWHLAAGRSRHAHAAGRAGAGG